MDLDVGSVVPTLPCLCCATKWTNGQDSPKIEPRNDVSRKRGKAAYVVQTSENNIFISCSTLVFNFQNEEEDWLY